jgi:hypothetical protein
MGMLGMSWDLMGSDAKRDVSSGCKTPLLVDVWFAGYYPHYHLY